ncbi:MAG: putative toxin-antitoxin system toxin component, PIN family [Clostridia bacterium]|nr:putative toxin-antitoxin system toxin component, PIN family [Clostridia bacterium]
MKTVIDTNVFISGIFFGGYPRKVLDALIDKKLSAFVSPEIINEYFVRII